MWLLGVCAAVAMTILAWKLVELSVKLGRARALLERIGGLVGRRMITEALAAARDAGDPAARVIVAGLGRRAAGSRAVAHALRTAELFEAARLERGLIALAALATIAPLAGALSATLNALRFGTADDFLALPVLEPFVTGLAMGLVISLLHMWLTSRIDRFAADVEHASERVVRALEAMDPPPVAEA